MISDRKWDSELLGLIAAIYKEAGKQEMYLKQRPEELEPLIAIPVFIHDFLSIHPFNDGNGRMSRLLTTLLLYRSGFYVGKYILLEAKIAKNMEKTPATTEHSESRQACTDEISTRCIDAAISSLHLSDCRYWYL